MAEGCGFRSFIAIPLTSAAQQQITQLQQRLKPLLAEVKFSRPENLHLTLCFLGEQTQEQLAEIGQTMLSIGRMKKDFNVELKGLGFFPQRQPPRVLWLGVEPEQQLISLRETLVNHLGNLAVAADKRTYRPHLTLGRFARAAQDPQSLCPFLSQSCGSLKIDRMVLYTSELAAQGAIHRPLTVAPLKAAEL